MTKKTNNRKRFRHAQWATLMFFFCLLIATISVFLTDSPARRIVIGVFALLGLVMIFWVSFSMQDTPEDEMFFVDYEELVKERAEYQEIINEWRDALIKIGKHEALKIVDGDKEQPADQANNSSTSPDPQ